MLESLYFLIGNAAVLYLFYWFWKNDEDTAGKQQKYSFEALRKQASHHPSPQSGKHD